MAKHSFLPAALIALALGAALGSFVTLKSCGPDKGYWIERSKYDADVKAGDANLAAALEVIAGKDKLIAEKDAGLAVREARIDELEYRAAGNAAELDALAKETAVLKADIAAVIAANPAVRALVENYDLRCAAYDRQVFSLCAIIDEERAAKGDWMAKFNAAVVQRDIWHRQYDDEYALRLTSDALRVGLEKKLYGGKFWKYVALGEPVIFGIVSLFGK